MSKVDMGALRSLYQKDVQGGAPVSEAQATELAKGADSAEGREFLEQRLEQDTFDPKARAVLETAISAKETPAEKKLDQASGLGPSGLAGTSAGKSGAYDVTIKRELGSKGGFDSKEQARAAAVLNGKPAVLVQDKAGKWHAGELAIDPKGKFTPNANTELVKQPDPAAIDAAKAAYDSASGSDKPEAYRKLVAASLGVDDKDVVLATVKPLKLTPGKINVTLGELDGGGADGQTGYVGKDGKVTTGMPTDGSDPGKSTVVIGKVAPTTAQHIRDTYLHESTHQAHGERVKDLVNQWRKESKNGKPALNDWMKSQVKAGKATNVDANLVKESTASQVDTRATEALAYTKAFVNAYGNGVQLGNTPDLNVAFDQLIGVSEHQPPDETKAEIGKELRQMFDGLPPAKQQEFRDYTAKRFNGTWLKDVLPK